MPKRPSRYRYAVTLLTAAVLGCAGPTAVVPQPVVPAMTVETTGAPAKPSGPLAAPAAFTGEVPSLISGKGRRDWTMDRFSGPRVVEARKTAGAANRRLLAYGANTGWSGGIALTAPAFSGVTGVPSNGPAYAYRGNDKLRFRVWFLTSTGWLLGVDKDNPTSTADPVRAPIKINMGRSCAQSYVTLSDDGARAYVVSDDGHVMMADLDAGTKVGDVSIDPAAPNGPSVGMSAFMDPILTDSQATDQDVMFVGNNAGKIARIEWNGTALTRVATKTGVTITSAADGSTTNLLKSTPVAINGVLYYGDRGGNAVVFDYAGSPQSIFLGATWPVETPVALELDLALVPSAIFACSGPESAWVDITNLASPTVQRSEFLGLDNPVGGTPTSNAGTLNAYTYQGMAINGTSNTALRYPAEAATAMVADTPPGLGMTLMNGDTVLGFLQSYRTASLGASEQIDTNLPTCNTVYGTANTAGNTVNYSFADQGTAVASRTKFSTPIDVFVGPYGEVYMGGKTDNNARIIKMIPSQDMPAGAWGYTAAILNAGTGSNVFKANRTYIIAGPGSPGSNATNLNEPHAVFYDDGNTPGNYADDILWEAEWAGNIVRRVARSNGALTTVASGLSGPHGIARAWGAPGGPVFISQASSNNLLKYNLATNTLSTAYAGMPGATHTNLCYLNGPNDGAQGSIYIPSRNDHVVLRYDIATNTLTTFAGQLSSSGLSADGTTRQTCRLNQPEALCGNPVTGDLYIGENGGRRLKVIYGSGTNAGRIYTLAGNGGSTYSGDGNAGPSVALGWISGIRLGPPDLSQPTVNPYGSLYMDSRDTHTLLRFDFPPRPAASTKGLMRWNFSAYPNRAFVRASLDMTVYQSLPATDGSGNVTTVAPPEVVTADRGYSVGLGDWTSAGLTPGNVPDHDARIKSIITTGTPGVPQAWTANATATYRLPVGSLPQDGSLSLAIIPPADTTTYHYAWGLATAYSLLDRKAVDFYGVNGTTAAQKPRLTAFLSNSRVVDPILSPPAVFSDGTVKYVYVMNTNTIFRLNFASAATWTGSTTYVTSRLGRGTNGTIDTTSTTPYPFIANPTPPLLLDNGDLLAIDRKKTGVTTWNFTLSKFTGLGATPGYVTPPTACQIDGQAVVGGLTSGTYFVSDSFGDDTGYAYFGLGNGKIYRLGL